MRSVEDVWSQAQQALFAERGRLAHRLEEIDRQLRSLDDTVALGRALVAANRPLPPNEDPIELLKARLAEAENQLIKLSTPPEAPKKAEP